MRRVCMTLALVTAIPLAARAEPISVNLTSSTNATVNGTATTDWSVVDMGELVLSGARSVATFDFSGMTSGSDYTVVLDVSNLTGLDSLRFEVLDPLDHDDGWDPNKLPAYVPTGYSTSNDFDGLSFAQNSGLTRSATFAGGSVFAVADEKTHRGDILMFSGLNGAEEARITFGLRDWLGGQRGFLIRVSALGDTSPSPEPASMLLVGTGVAGIACAYRRRRNASRA